MVLDVSVLDENRLPVRGLTAADFAVLEDGRPQKVQSFSAIDLPDIVRETAAPWLREVTSDVRSNVEDENHPVVVMVLDDHLPMSALDALWVKRVGREIVEQLSWDDVAAVVYTWEKGLGQEFTHDRARLLAAVERFNPRMDRVDPQKPKERQRVPVTDARDPTITTLKELCDELAALPGRRKTILYPSPGLALGPHDTVLWVQVAEFLAAAARANVNVYGIDPGGLRAPTAEKDIRTGITELDMRLNREGRDFLLSVSGPTGGFAVVDTNDFTSNITQVFRENRSYYLLGYASSERRAAGRFRKIEVRVNRPGATVRSRSGYYEPGPPDTRPKKPTPSSPVDAALAGIVPKTDLPLQVTALRFAVPGKAEAAVALVLGVRQSKPLRGTRLVANVRLRASAVSPDGKQRTSRREQIPVTLNTAGFAGMMGYEILTRLDLKPGRYYVRVGAETSFRGIRPAPGAPEVGLVGVGQDLSPKSGSVYCDLDVPDFQGAALSMSGIAMSVTPAMPSGPKDRFKALLPIVPTTLRDFTRDDAVVCFFKVYQGDGRALVPVSLTTRVLDGSNAVVFEAADTLGPGRFGKDRAADCNLALPMSRFGQGPHLLVIEATAGEKTARREVRFQMQQ